MGEGFNKPRFSQRCLQTFFMFLSHPHARSRVLSLLADVFEKNKTKGAQQRLFTGYKNILNRNI